MKKAFIDQIMLGIFLFASLIIIGATILDDIEARNKYYKLKSLTNNAALSAAKYYIDVENDTDSAETIANNILLETSLGAQIKDEITYTWDFISDPYTVTVSLPDYKHETFWYKFLDLASFDLNTSSIATIEDLTETSDLAPFGINGCDDSHLYKDNIITFNLSGNRGYTDTDYNEFYGIDLGNACTASGNSNWAHFKNDIKDFYVEDGFVKNDESVLDTDIYTDFCVPEVNSLAKEQNNDPKQISQSFKNLENSYDLIGTRMHMALFQCGSTADNLLIDKFIEVELLTNPSTTYSKVKNDYDQFEFQLKIIGTKTKDTVKLVK